MKMRYILRTLRAVIVAALLTTAAITSSCVWTASSPRLIERSDVAIGSGGEPVFSGYDSIHGRRHFSDNYYVLMGVEVREGNCSAGPCGGAVWQARNYDSATGNLLDKTLALPDSIAYGQSFDGLKEYVAPKPLVLNTPYTLTIEAVGLDINYRKKATVSVRQTFMLTEGENGKRVELLVNGPE